MGVSTEQHMFLTQIILPDFDKTSIPVYTKGWIEDFDMLPFQKRFSTHRELTLTKFVLIWQFSSILHKVSDAIEKFSDNLN